MAAIGSWVEEKSTKLTGWIIFGLPILILIYTYFEGYKAAKVAELDHRWTAASLSVGFLPFAAVPVVLAAWLIGFILIAIRRKKHGPS